MRMNVSNSLVNVSKVLNHIIVDCETVSAVLEVEVSDALCAGSSRGHSMSGSAYSSSYEYRDNRVRDGPPPPKRSSSSHDYEEGPSSSKRLRDVPPRRSPPSFSYTKMQGGGGGGYPPSRH